MKSKKIIKSVMVAACYLFFGITTGDSILAEETQVSVYTTLPGVPEGLCIDSKNNLYATVSFTGELVKLNDDGTYDHIAWVPTKEDSGKGQLIGIEADNQDNIYAAYK